jgi:molecular chaperone DnaK (HSP70)
MAATGPFLVGIDLGTTHTVVASARTGGTEITVFDIPQWTGPGEWSARPLLTSRPGTCAPSWRAW